MNIRKIPALGSLLRSYFFGGLLVVIPLGVITWILLWAADLLWGLQSWIPEELKPENVIPNATLAAIVNGAVVLTLAFFVALGVSIVGWISKQYLGRKILDFIAEGIIQHIPVVRSIYSALDQLLKTMAQGGGQQFSRVVYVEYPRKGVWALAFVTGPARGPNLPPGHLNLYVPTTPNPTSGFHLIALEAEVRESGMKVEEAFKTILSLGIAQPDSKPNG